jgi:predicted DCC family thiol-disulfide oxidoreductase YuxK
MFENGKKTTMTENAIVPPKDWSVQVFYDGDCPLCRREIEMIRKLDRKQIIWFADIANKDFNSSDWGKNIGQLMAEIHVRRPSGEWLIGVEAFRAIYRAIGFQRLVLLSRLPLIRFVLNWGYHYFAKNRLRFTGRCPETGCSLKT